VLLEQLPLAQWNKHSNALGAGRRAGVSLWILFLALSFANYDASMDRFPYFLNH
jgi:hypothetical protein